jgi:hypothetical protein
MEKGRPQARGIITGLVISFLGLGSYFGVALYTRLKVGYDSARMSIEQWVVEVAIWLCCVGAFVVLVGILWYLVRGRTREPVGGEVRSEPGSFSE